MEVIRVVMDRLRMGRVPEDRYRPVRGRHLKAGEESAAGRSVYRGDIWEI